MKMNHVHHMRKSRKGFSLVELLVVIAIIAGLAAMSYGPIMKQVRAAAQTSAINDGRQIYTALFSYAKDNNGIFPDGDLENTGEASSSVTDCFNQLLQLGLVDDESVFWNKENANVLESVDLTEPDANGELESGENVWGYVNGLNSSMNTTLPILFDSSNNGTTFDTGVWNGYAIVAKLDGSVKAYQINFTGNAVDENGESQQKEILVNGKDLFDKVDKLSSKGVEKLTPSS
jgi:prepilin-type N-terminal cleavage/methylation domain-containing protein